MKSGLAALLLLAMSAVPTPTVALSRTHICFFDPGSAELSARCQQFALAFYSSWNRVWQEEKARAAPALPRLPQVE